MIYCWQRMVYIRYCAGQWYGTKRIKKKTYVNKKISFFLLWPHGHGRRFVSLSKILEYERTLLLLLCTSYSTIRALFTTNWRISFWLSYTTDLTSFYRLGQKFSFVFWCKWKLSKLTGLNKMFSNFTFFSRLNV